MAFSKVKVGGLADDSVTAANIDDDGTGYTVGNLTNSGTLQQTGQVTLGTGSGSGGNWTLPTARGTDKYVLQINGTTGASTWAESLTAPEISGHNFDVSGSTDDGGINAYEAPYEYTGTTNQTTTISSLSSTTGLLAGQYISGAGIPADTTIVSVNTGASTMVISNAATASAAGVALKIQKTPGEKNGGKVTLTGANFGATIGEITVAITNDAGVVIANASYLSGLSGGNTIVAEWTGTEGSYSTDLTSSYTGSIYFKMTKSGLSSNVHNTNATLTSDPAVTTLSGSSQTGGDVFTDPSATSLGAYGSGKVAGGGQDSNTKLLLNFDRTGGTDIEDSSNTGGDGHKVTASGNAVIKASPFGDGKSAIYFSSANDKLLTGTSSDFDINRASTFTIDFWFYRGSNDQYQRIVSQDTGTNYNGWALTTFASSHPGRLEFGNDNQTKFPMVTDVPLNEWHYYRLTGDGTTLRWYLDGKLDSSASATSITDFTQTNKALLFGLRADGYDLNNGFIDEFRLINGTAVSTGDSHDVPTSRFSESDATNTKLLIHSNQDHSAISGNSQIFPLDIEGDGVYQRTETTARNSSAASNWDNSAWYFDGGSSGALYDSRGGADNNYADVCPTATSEMTVEFWTKSNSTSSTQMYLIDAGSTGWNLRYTPSSNAWVLFSNAFDGNGQMSLGTHDIADNAWHHVALVKYVDGSNKNRVKFYIDGVLKTTSSNNTSDSNAVWPTNNAFRIGGDGGFYEGYIDDFRITKGLVVYTGAFTPPTTKLTTTWSAGTNIAANSDASKVAFLLKSVDGNSGTGGFIDSATSGTTHAITPTGTKHKIGYGGIAPAMAFPASKKLTGSTGIYFDGGNDSCLKIDATTANGNLSELNLGNNTDFTIDCWVYFNNVSSSQTLFSRRHNKSSGDPSAWWLEIVSGTAPVTLRLRTQETATTLTSSAAIYPNRWHHITLNRDVSNSNLITLYVDATSVGTYNSAAVDMEDGTPNANQDFLIGGVYSAGSIVDELNGYIDSFRYVKGSCITPTANPTKVYGAFGQETPDVGTITLTATGDGDFTWSEVAGGTALPGTLAVSSTTKSGSGNSATHTATITGSFSALTSSFANGTRSDQATNNILLKVQHDTDATKAVTLNGTTGMGITQKSTERPILFGGRRWHGNGVAGREMTGLGFQPDLLIGKDRDDTNWWMWVDSVRGAHNANSKVIYSNSNVGNDNPSGGDTFSAFNKDGFEIGANTRINDASRAFSAWAFKAGGSPVSISATGATSVTQSASSTTGLSITQFTGPGNNSSTTVTIPHNLGGTPEFILYKNTSNAWSWLGYHKDAAQGVSDTHTSEIGASRYTLHFNSNTDRQTNGYINNAGSAQTGANDSGFIGTPTSTNIIFRPGNSGSTKSNYYKDTGVIYAFKGVAGLSKFGYYDGGTSNKTIDLDFFPRLLVIKRINGSAHWMVYDQFRSGATASGESMWPYLSFNTNETESSANDDVDLYESGSTKGVQLLATSNYTNQTGGIYIYMAFA